MVRLTVSGIGIALGILWMLTNQLTTQRIDYWETQLILLEETHSEPHPVRVFGGEAYNKAFGNWLRFGNILGLLAFLATVAWTILLGMAIRTARQPQ